MVKIREYMVAWSTEQTVCAILGGITIGLGTSLNMHLFRKVVGFHEVLGSGVGKFTD